MDRPRHNFTRRRNRRVVQSQPSDAEPQIMDFSDRVNTFLVEIRSLTGQINDLNARRRSTAGTVREAYTTIITDHLQRMVRLIDEYKTIVCESITDYDADAVLNTARFPNICRY